jgi:hypothetical protein
VSGWVPAGSIAMPLTEYGRFAISIAQFSKGCAFLGAAHLLQEKATQEAQHYVCLHLICQGAELIFKGILLLKDFKKYRPRERKFGHKVAEIAKVVHSEYGLNPLRPDIVDELTKLEERFSSHSLRYAGVGDICINLYSLEHKKFLRYLVAIIRLTNRHIRKSPHAHVA